MLFLNEGVYFFFQAEDGIRDRDVTGVQTCALPISRPARREPVERDRADRQPRGERRLLGREEDLQDLPPRLLGARVLRLGQRHRPALEPLHEVPVLVLHPPEVTHASGRTTLLSPRKWPGRAGPGRGRGPGPGPGPSPPHIRHRVLAPRRNSCWTVADEQAQEPPPEEDGEL